MIIVSSLGALGLVTGVIVAQVGAEVNNYTQKLQRWGGALFLAGAALLGLAFPLMI